MKSLSIVLLSLLLSTIILSDTNGNNYNFWKKFTFFKSTKQELTDLENISKTYLSKSDLEIALKYANQGLALSIKNNYQVYVASFYNILGHIYFRKNQLDTGIEYFNKEIKVAEQINNKEIIAKAYINIGILKQYQAKNDEALNYINKALVIFVSIDQKENIADAYFALALIYHETGELKKALDNTFKAIKAIKSARTITGETGRNLLYNNYLNLADIYNGLGKYDSSFYYLNIVVESGKNSVPDTKIAYAYASLSDVLSFYGDYSKALEYSIKGLELSEKLRDKDGIASGYSGIGQIFEKKNDPKNAIKYYKKCLDWTKANKIGYANVNSDIHLGNNYYKLQEYEIAKQYLFDGLQIAEKMNSQAEIASANNILGLIFYEQKEYQKAIGFHFESLKIYQKLSNKSGEAETYFNIGSYYQKLAEYSKAIQYLNEALKIDEEIKSLPETKDVLLSLSENYYGLSLFKPAYNYFKKYEIINDSLKSESHIKRITQLEMQYEFNKKQNEQQFNLLQKEQNYKAKIKTQKILIFSVITLIITLTLLSLFAFRNYRLRQNSIKQNIELQRVEAEKKREVDQMKLNFFANASHDIRTPLTLIKGPLQELIDSKEVPSSLQNNLERIYRNANLLHRFADQILDFQKLDSGAMNLNLAHGDIVKLTRKTIENFGYYIESKKCTFDFYSNYNELVILYDEEKIEKVLYNLIFNAIKFTPENGTIKVNINADQEKVNISIKDSGLGIPQEQLEQIFERYYQVDKNKNFFKGGSGIGLAHVKELLTLHKGDIKVKSSESEGSEFTVILNRSDKIYEAELITNLQNQTSSKKNITPVNKKNIDSESFSSNENKLSALVIEDDYDMHQYIVNCIESDFNIYHAYNGYEGYNQALKHNPDIIISDVMMDKMDGIELCAKIKTDLQVCHIPVILLTALASTDKIIIGFENGADDYISKPFDKKLLITRVWNLIQSRKLLRRVFSESLIIEPQNITVSSIDAEFLKKAVIIVEENISDSSFNVDALCEKMNVSRSVFFRKIKSLTDLSSNDFIKDIRLKRAAQLLKSNNLTISQIADEVGFTNQKYFSTCFNKYFGKSPSEYARINSKA
jgi:signal transduction histidine kinase/DNA-binding response OmpR family regulator